MSLTNLSLLESRLKVLEMRASAANSLTSHNGQMLEVESPIMYQQMDDDDSRLSHATSNNSSSYIVTKTFVPCSSLLEYVERTPKLYHFSYFTGILSPNFNSQNQHHLKYRIWIGYLRVCFAGSSLFCMLYGIFILSIKVSQLNALIAGFAYFGLVLQNFFLYPAIINLRREIRAPRVIDEAVYEQAFQHSIFRGMRVLILFTLFLLIFIVVDCYLLIAGPGVITLVAFCVFFFLTPANLFLAGLLTFLIVEQRVSFHTMMQIKDKLDKQGISFEEYFEARESIDARDRRAPINWLVAAAVWNTIICIVLIFVVTQETNLDTPSNILSDVLFVLAAYGRQIIVLFVMFYEIAKVNEISHQMIHSLARSQWKDQETQKLSLYIAVKECPMGSTLFYTRPSRNQLFINMASAAGGIGFAIFWAFVFS